MEPSKWIGGARYIIVLDRYDEEDDYAEAHGGDPQKAKEQVAKEIQEAMDFAGVPAGFFQVIARTRNVKMDERVTEASMDQLRLSAVNACEVELGTE